MYGFAKALTQILNSDSDGANKPEPLSNDPRLPTMLNLVAITATEDSESITLETVPLIGGSVP